MRTYKTLITCAVAAALTLLAAPAGDARVAVGKPQGILALPRLPVAVAPNQPQVTADSTRGIINALCDVTLNLLGCGFFPTSATLTCDTNGDGVPELQVPLKNITFVNRLLVQATLPALSPQLPGTAFPLTCCGGIASLTLSRTVGPGDNNALGGFTQSVTCPIDLGLRAPVVISISPSNGDCSRSQNLLIPGSCFIQPDGTPNVTSVFLVERGNPSNVIQATKFVILNPNLLDALFDFGAADAGKTFLIFVSGPNGTSRNLTSLPEAAPQGCVLGNEQGIIVTFTCDAARATGGGTPPSESPLPDLISCQLNRNSSGSFSLTIRGRRIKGDATITIGGIQARKVKFKDPTTDTDTFARVIVKGRLCDNLPGMITVDNHDGRALATLQCLESCSQQ